ncbi:MAG: ribosome-binding factor A [Candidatus Poriferisodalaceae bacterium]|jgi:ribosome-binding factor A
MSRIRGPKKDFPRTARVGELIREIVGQEITAIDDPRLYVASLTGVDVDNELVKATLYYDVLDDEDRAEVAEAFDDHRHRLQKALASQARLRRTPTLHFTADSSIGNAGRIESILDGLKLDETTVEYDETLYREREDDSGGAA